MTDICRAHDVSLWSGTFPTLYVFFSLDPLASGMRSTQIFMTRLRVIFVEPFSILTQVVSENVTSNER